MVNTGNGLDGNGVSKVTNEIAKVIAQVPPVVESLTGLKVDDLVKGLHQKTMGGGSPPSPSV